MNLLIVDDNSLNRKLLRVTLEAEGHSTLEASDGVEALEILGRGKVDAVISDILMPNMDGFQLCHKMRQREDLKHIAFMHFTSTYTSSGDQQHSKTVGADRYLAKPASTEVLVRTIGEAMRHAEERQASTLRGCDTAFVMKNYSVVLVNKLEEKNRELEETITELRCAHSTLWQLKDSLEQRVKERTSELETANQELTRALSEVKELSGLLPICAYCKQIRDDKNYWQSVEGYLCQHTNVLFSHGICPPCYDKLIKDLPKLPSSRAEIST